MLCRAMIASAILLVVVPMRVAAQAAITSEPPHSVGASVQWAYPYRSTDPLQASPGLEATYREWVRPRVALELEFGSWQRTYSGTYRLAGYMVPPSRAGEVVYSTYTTHVSSYSAGINVLGRIPIGRAALIGGAGPALFVDRRHDSSLVNDAVQNWSTTSTRVGVQSLAAVELRITDHVGAFGGVRAELRAIDTLVTYPIAGGRFSF